MQIGNYEVLKLIGEGGFARTYLAEHKLLGEKACLKQNLNIDDENNEILMREAKLMWGLSHYSLPAVRDLFPAKDGSYVLAMSYVEGKTIEEIVEKNGPIHPEDVSWIAQRTLSVLHYVHFNGIVHCDVKPQNILLLPKQHNIGLVDYGLSAFRPKGDTKAIGYTPVYAAPEIKNGLPPTPAADYYGVGLTMIYALGGDVRNKECPKRLPEPMKQFISSLVKSDPLERPDSNITDLVEVLSEVRQESFGRKHTR